MLVVFIIWVPLASIGFRINRREEREAEEAELLREWEAQAIMSKLRGRAPPVRPGYTNSPGPM